MGGLPPAGVQLGEASRECRSEVLGGVAGGLPATTPVTAGERSSTSHRHRYRHRQRHPGPTPPTTDHASAAARSPPSTGRASKYVRRGRAATTARRPPGMAEAAGFPARCRQARWGRAARAASRAAPSTRPQSATSSVVIVGPRGARQARGWGASADSLAPNGLRARRRVSRPAQAASGAASVTRLPHASRTASDGVACGPRPARDVRQLSSKKLRVAGCEGWGWGRKGRKRR